MVIPIDERLVFEDSLFEDPSIAEIDRMNREKIREIRNKREFDNFIHARSNVSESCMILNHMETRNPAAAQRIRLSLENIGKEMDRLIVESSEGRIEELDKLLVELKNKEVR